MQDEVLGAGLERSIQMLNRVRQSGVSYSALARLANIPRSTLTAILQGRVTNPTVSTLEGVNAIGNRVTATENTFRFNAEGLQGDLGRGLLDKVVTPRTAIALRIVEDAAGNPDYPRGYRTSQAVSTTVGNNQEIADMLGIDVGDTAALVFDY